MNKRQLTYYQRKDAVKFSICNKLIARGAPGTSSDYWRANPPVANMIINADTYEESDIVGISVNGNRRGRISFDRMKVRAVMAAGATIVCDNEANAQRGYNLGERELRGFMEEYNYLSLMDTNERAIFAPKAQVLKNIKQLAEKAGINNE